MIKSKSIKTLGLYRNFLETWVVYVPLYNENISPPFMTYNITTLTFVKLILSICLLWLIQGCTSITAKGNLMAAANVSQLTQWQASGKLAFITPTDKQSVNFIWSQNNDDYKVNFNTFLGINVLSIKRDRNGIVISADGKDYQSDNPQQLVFELTGWWLPMDNLSRWLKADITDNEGDISVNNIGNIQSFTPHCDQTNCANQVIIHYDQFQSAAHLILPHRLTIKTQGITPQTLKIKVQRWL